MTFNPVDAPTFPYRGGKARLRRFVIRFFPRARYANYVEPFAGRGNVFYLAQRFFGYSNSLLNDLQTIPFLTNIRNYAGQPIPIWNKEETLANAGSYIASIVEPLTYWAGGLPSRGTSVTGWRGKTAEAYQLNVERAAHLLQTCHFSTIDATEILQAIPSDTFVYLDPPYQGASVGSYSDGMVHRGRMISLLSQANFPWLLSEYRCPDLDAAFGPPVATLHGVQLTPNPGGKAREVAEVLYANYPAEPLILDFQDIEKPMKVALDILAAAQGVLTEQAFNEQAPAHWGTVTRRCQFERLTTRPFCYWDGLVLKDLRTCLKP